jgi:transcriptional regulator with XRE-family HTH domain
MAKLQKICGNRLRSARRAAGISEAEASRAIGHRGATQLSLCESGERLMPLAALYTLADLYSVSIDWLLDRINDPICDPVENNQGLLARSIRNDVESAFAHFSALMSHQAILFMKAQRDDHADLKFILGRLDELGDAMLRFKDLNPTFEEDMRGSARLDASVEKLVESAKRIADRIIKEEAQRQAVIGHHAEGELDAAYTKMAGLTGMRQLFFPLAESHK